MFRNKLRFLNLIDTASMAPLADPNVPDYRVHVSAWQIGPPVKDDTLDTSQLLIKSKVEVTYQSETQAAKPRGSHNRKSIFSVTKSVPRRFMDLETPQSSRFSCNSFVSDGRKAVSAMISDMNIPFSLENMQWRSPINVPWTALADRNDLINHIFDVASSLVNNKSSSDFVEFRMCVIIEKRVILPDQDYEAMVRDRADQESTKMAITGTIQELIQYQAASGKKLSRTELQQKVEDSLREKGKMILRRNSIEEIVKQIQRSEPNGGRLLSMSSLKNASADVIRVRGRDVKLMDRCAICIQEVELRSFVTRLPCSHMFHRECIREWLGKSPCCPLCRFNLSRPN